MIVIFRIIAFLIDNMIFLILFIPFIILGVVLIKSEYAVYGIMLFSLMLSLIFSKDSFGIRTIGRRLMNINVINLNQDIPYSPWRFTIRNIFYCLYPIEGFAMLFNSQHRRIGDLIAKTNVVKSRKSKFKFQWKGFIVLLTVWISLFLIGLLIKAIDEL